MRLLRPIQLGLALFAALISHIAFSLPNDREQAIHISADQAMRDEKQGLTVYTGNVIFDQGSLHITADKVTIFQSEDGEGKIVAIGQPARLQQRPEKDAELMRAHAETIEYFEKEDRIHLQTNAKIQQGGSTVTGKTIDYYISEELVKANSDANVENSRVKVVIPANMLEKKEDDSGSTDGK